MRLFLTITAPNGDGTAVDTVPLFDDGVWTRGGPSPDAVTRTPAAFVARELYRQAALTKLLRTSAANVVCFRYGPRPPAAQDVVFFHKRHSPAAAAPKALSVRALPSGDSLGMSSTLVTPSTSLSSVRSARSLLSPIEPPLGLALTSPRPAAFYDSFAALWLLETVATARQHVTASACLFYVDGNAVDLVTRQDLQAPLSIHSGSTRRLRCAEDVHVYLARCEQSLQEATRRRARRTPFHLWMTACVGVGPESQALPAVTFVDVAYPLDVDGEASGEGDAAARVHEQLRLFHRQLRLTAASSRDTSHVPPPPSGAWTTADRRWLGFLQSCQLPSAKTIGVFTLAQRTGRDVFACADKVDDCDPFVLSAELRQRALEDAVNCGVLHPQPKTSRQRAMRGNAKGAKARRGVGVSLFSPPASVSIFAASPVSQQLEGTPQLPPLRHHHQHRPARSQEFTASPVDAPLHGRPAGVSSGRRKDVFALLSVEEAAARSALSEGEVRARELTWLRWALQAHTPNTSVAAVARQLAAAATRVERPVVRSAPLKRPPPLQQADLAATVRVFNLHSTSPSHKAHTVTHNDRQPSVEHLPDLVPILTPAVSLSRAGSTAASPSFRVSAGASAASRSAVHAEFLVEVLVSGESGRPEQRWRTSSASVSPHPSASTSRATSGRRRYSTLEVTLLDRAHSSTRGNSSATSGQSCSEVEMLFPLVRSYHGEVVAQDGVMAAEMMARSKIELREMNRRRALEKMVRGRGTAEAGRGCGRVASGKRYSASPRASRVFFNA